MEPPPVVRWPHWLDELVTTGEALAMLALSGSLCVSLTPAAVGTDVHTTPRRVVNRRLEALTGTWHYHVGHLFGDGSKGRAIAFLPKHQDGHITLAFRGVRNKEPDEEADRKGPRNDRINLGRWEPATAPWLEGQGMHSGIFDHHGSLWDELGPWLASLCSSGQPPTLLFVGLSFGGSLAQACAFRAACEFPALLPRMRVLAFGAVLWGSPPVARRFNELFGTFEGATGPRAVQLVTTCLLPEVAEARVASMPPWWVLADELASSPNSSPGASPVAQRRGVPACLHVPVSDSEVDALAEEVAAVTTELRTAYEAAYVEPVALRAEVHHAAGASPMGPQGCTDDSGYADRNDGRPVYIFDPLAVRTRPSKTVYYGVGCVIPCRLPVEPDEESFDSFVDVDAAQLIRRARITAKHWADFVSFALPKSDPVIVDYTRLHYGRRYQQVLMSMLLQSKSDGSAHLQAVDQLRVAERVAEHTAPGITAPEDATDSDALLGFMV